MKLPHLIIVLALGISGLSHAQSDAYLKRIGATKASYTIRDSSMLNKLNSTATDSMYTNTNKGEKYARLAYSISKKIEYSRGAIESLINLSRAKLYSNDYDSAMVFANQSIARSKRLPEGKLIIKSYETKGVVYHYQGKYDKAIIYYLKSIAIAERINQEYAVNGYGNIGLVFKQIGNRTKALEYQNKSLKASKKYKDSMSMAAALNNLGILSKDSEDYKKALIYYKKGLAIATAIDFTKVKANILNNMANVYFILGEHKIGMEYFEESLEESKTASSFTDIAIQYHNLSYNLYDLGRFSESLIASEKALLYADSAHNFQLLVEANAMSANLFYDLGNYHDAYTFLTYAYAYKDSMNLLSLNDLSVDAEEVYQKQKKAIADSLADAQRIEEKRRETQLNDEKVWFREILLMLAAFALVIVAIGAYFLFKSNKLVKAKNRIVEEQHTEITDSIAYAQRIQNAMISNEDAWQKISPHRFIFFKPKDVVSGDFHWAHFDEEKQLGLWAVADCTGHGVPGAFMSMLGTSFLNQIIIEGGQRKPGEILDLLRKKVLSALSKKGEDQPKDGMDIGLCVWEKESRMLHFAGANNPLWVIRKRANYLEDDNSDASGRIIDNPEFDFVLIEIPANKMPIGHFPGAVQPFRTKSIQLSLGDTLIMSTDGYADQFGGPKGKKFKSKPFKEFLVKIQAKLIGDQLELVQSTFEEWQGDEEQVDDICVIGVRVS